MKRLLLVLALVTGCASISRGVASAPSLSDRAQFSMVVTTTETGWAARCDSGCHWTRLSAVCAIACRAIVDASGLNAAQTERRDSSAFAFELTRTARGMQAISRSGTAWKTVSWQCDSDPCTARLDFFGVGAPVASR